jgi:UDP-N-acetylglucosamine transferase subunit ALG13
MKFKNIFVTVGTTEFNSLIKKLQSEEVYKILKNHLGCEKLVLQIGHGEKISFAKFELKVEIFDLKESIMEDIERADLVRC